LGKGKKIEDILLGVHKSIAARSAGLVRRVGIEEEVTFTGGVALNLAMIETLNQRLGVKVNVSEESHFMGALGAALFALDHILASRIPHRQSSEQATKVMEEVR
jgi:activator of 2-hydroxyglutaryl-CoA dehydratase